MAHVRGLQLIECVEAAVELTYAKKNVQQNSIFFCMQSKIEIQHEL